MATKTQYVWIESGADNKSVIWAHAHKTRKGVIESWKRIYCFDDEEVEKLVKLTGQDFMEVFSRDTKTVLAHAWRADLQK